MPKDRRRRRRIMKEFVINEISAVDEPAQSGAKMTILKRHEKDSKMSDENKSSEELRKDVAELLKKLTKDDKDSTKDLEKTIEALVKSLEKDEDDNSSKVEDLEKKLETLEKVSSLPDVEKEYYEKLKDEDKAAFLAKSDEDRAEEVEKSKADDPVVFKAADGTEYYKSDDPRLVQMAKDREKDRKEIAKQRAKEIDDSLTKRAETDLANLPGDLDVRKAILKGVDAIEDEKLRENAVAALKAHNAKMHEAFETIGIKKSLTVDDDVKKSAEDKLDALAKKYAEENKVDYYTAYDKVCESNADLLNNAVGSTVS